LTSPLKCDIDDPQIKHAPADGSSAHTEETV
jgi:hypothetical protein